MASRPAVTDPSEGQRAAASVAVDATDPFAGLSAELRCICDLAGVLLEVSPGWSEVLGWSRAELVGRSFLDRVHPDDLAISQQAVAALSRGAEVVSFEPRVLHRDGGYRWLWWDATAVTAEGVVYAVVRDVTEERRRQAFAAELEQVTGVGNWELDLETGLVHWSPWTRSLHGLGPDDPPPDLDGALAFFPPESRRHLTPALERLAATGTPYDLELSFQPRSGPRLWVRATGRAQWRGKDVVRVYGTFQDLTDVHAEREGLRPFRQLVELSEEGILALDARAHITFANRRLASLLGAEPGDLVGSPLAAIVAPDDRELAREWSRRFVGGDTDVIRGALRVLGRDGAPRWTQVAARASRAPGGWVTAVTAVVTDITAARRTEDALRANEDLLRRVLAATNDGWWDSDLVTGTAEHSERWWEIYGYAPGALRSTPDLWRSLSHPEDLPRLDAAFAEVLARGETTFTLTGRGLHRRGHPIPLVIRGLIDYDIDGQPIRISGATTDVTDARQAEIAKEEFISTVSHELRTPLTSIGGAHELLRAGVAGELPEPAMRLLEVAERNTIRLRVLIDDLLDMERLLTDESPLHLAIQELGPLLRQAVADLEPHARTRRIALAVDEPVPSAWVSVDTGRLQQVVSNYLSNAVKFAPPGSTVDLQVRCDEDHVRVEVVDRGPGVPDTLGDTVFDRFVQADPVDHRSRGGTGLGLAISRELVQRFGGEVGFTSRPGRTGFWFTLPLVPDEPGPLDGRA